MESPSTSLPETLRRLQECVEEQELRANVLNPRTLAAKTALHEATVRVLLQGGRPAECDIEQRVRDRIKTLTAAHQERTGRRLVDLVVDVSQRLDISEVWARKLLTGEKMPNVKLLYGLADFFQVDGGEFFTAPPAEALNRALLPVLKQHEEPDPVQALMERYGVVRTDLRQHGTMTPEQLERLLASVIRSVVPSEGDAGR